MTIKRENFYHSYIHEGFIFTVSLLNDLMKIIVGPGIFNSVIFKYLGYDCHYKNSISQYHHIALVARISLTLSRHSSLSFIALGRSSGQHPVSSHSC